MNSFREYVEPVCLSKPAGRATEQLVINAGYQPFLDAIGFTGFDAVWGFSGGEVIKQKGERTVVRLRFQRPAVHEAAEWLSPAGDITFYLKKHCQRLGLWQRLRCLLRPEGACGEGLKEFYHYCQFRLQGLATAVPVAAGARFTSPLRINSFLITRDFSPLTALEEMVLRRPASLQGTVNQEKRRALLRAIALYARRMHASGMNQKDFNATHLLLEGLETGRPQVALFDLQRVDRNPLNRLHWPVKALAELNYTLPAAIFDEDDRLFLFSAYKAIESLSLLDRWQYRLIRRKTDRIARHTSKRGLAPKMAG